MFVVLNTVHRWVYYCCLLLAMRDWCRGYKWLANSDHCWQKQLNSTWDNAVFLQNDCCMWWLVAVSAVQCDVSLWQLAFLLEVDLSDDVWLTTVWRDRQCEWGGWEASYSSGDHQKLSWRWTVVHGTAQLTGPGLMSFTLLFYDDFCMKSSQWAEMINSELLHSNIYTLN